jgi:glycosyltransferase involved in cell wall biosynthesis
VNVDVTEINPGVDTTEFKPREQNHSSNKQVLFVGRFVPAKNIPLLIDAFDSLQKDHPDAELVLVGDGPLKSKVEQKIRKLGLSESVRMPGYLDQEELPQYYNDADVFVLSSRYDNHPIVLLEAMSCGTTVVAPELGWIPNMIADEETGLLYEPGNETELVEAISRLLVDRDLREEIGTNARKSAVESSDWEQRAKKLKRLYESLTK